MKKIIAIASLCAVMSAFANDGYKTVTPVHAYDFSDMSKTNKSKVLVIKHSSYHRQVQRGETSYGVKNDEVLSLRVISLTAPSQEILKNKYVSIGLRSYDQEKLGSRKFCLPLMPDLITDPALYQQLRSFEESTLYGDALNEIDVIDGNSITINLGGERYGCDDTFGVYRLNPIALEKLKVGQAIRFEIGSTSHFAETMVKGVVEIKKEKR